MPRKTNVTITVKGKDGKEYAYNKYRVRATIGKKEDGKPLIKVFYGTSKKEAEELRDEFLAGLKQGLAVDYDTLSSKTEF